MELKLHLYSIAPISPILKLRIIDRTLDPGPRTPRTPDPSPGPRTSKPGPRTLDPGPRTLDPGPWSADIIFLDCSCF